MDYQYFLQVFLNILKIIFSKFYQNTLKIFDLEYDSSGNLDFSFHAGEDFLN